MKPLTTPFILALLLSFLLNGKVIAQKITPADSLRLDSLKKELGTAETMKQSAESRIKALKADIDKLTPVVAWKKGGFAAINFNQMGFSNWAAGGINALSVTTLGNLYFNYNKGHISWNNNLDVAYGMLQNKGQELRKNEDKIDFLTKFGHQSPVKNLNYAVLANFKSQFAPSYTYDNKNVRSPMIASFMAPAFILASIGIDYKPKPFLSFYLSPATGKFTIVTLNDVSIKKSFAVDTNKSVRKEFGALMNMFFQKDLRKNVNLLARLALFNNYTDVNTANRKNIDINMETMLNTRITKYLSATLYMNWIYDNDIQIAYDENDPTRVGPRLQFKEVFGIGFSYKF